MRLERNTQAPEIPTASMADVAFLLLVFFLVTSVFTQDAGIELRLPEREPLARPHEQAVHLAIDSSGGVRIDGVELATAADVATATRERVLAAFTLPASVRPVVVTADSAAPYGRVVEAYDGLRLAEKALRSEGRLARGQQLRVALLGLEEMRRLAARSSGHGR